MKTSELENNYSREIANFFGINMVPIEFRVFGSKEEYALDWANGNKELAATIPEWSVANAMHSSENDIVRMLTPELIEKLKVERPELNWKKLLKHEIVHIYYTHYKGNGSPKWLGEGTCRYLADQPPKSPLTSTTIETLDQYHDQQIKGCASNGYFIVEQIMKNYGRKKLLEIIKMTDRQTRYAELKRMFDWLK
jgi:hypothetical protein